MYSDVVTLVEQDTASGPVRVPTVFSDVGQARLRVAMKNPTNPTGPTSINSITINRYRAEFRRADGRNTPGVDVPHAFDGATTFTVPADTAGTFGFEVVRHQAKQEPPLRNLAPGPRAAEPRLLGPHQMGKLRRTTELIQSPA